MPTDISMANLMDVASDTALGPEILRWKLVKEDAVEKVLVPPKEKGKDKKKGPKQKVLETTEYFEALNIKALEMCPPDYACPFWSNDLRKVHCQAGPSALLLLGPCAQLLCVRMGEACR